MDVGTEMVLGAFTYQNIHQMKKCDTYEKKKRFKID